MSCTCHGCGVKYKVDVLVPDELWVKIYYENREKAKDGGGLLCPICIMSRIIELDEYLALRYEV